MAGLTCGLLWGSPNPGTLVWGAGTTRVGDGGTMEQRERGGGVPRLSGELAAGRGGPNGAFWACALPVPLPHSAGSVSGLAGRLLPPGLRGRLGAVRPESASGRWGQARTRFGGYSRGCGEWGLPSWDAGAQRLRTSERMRGRLPWAGMGDWLFAPRGCGPRSVVTLDQSQNSEHQQWILTQFTGFWGRVDLKNKTKNTECKVPASVPKLLLVADVEGWKIPYRE